MDSSKHKEWRTDLRKLPFHLRLTAIKWSFRNPQQQNNAPLYVST